MQGEMVNLHREIECKITRKKFHKINQAFNLLRGRFTDRDLTTALI